MIITSPNFDDGTAIPRKFTCDGGGINPELQIQNVPPDAKSLALVLHDPDASVEGGFYHWVVWNIGPGTATIKDESVPPESIEGSNSSEGIGYVPPCPPSGVHHYIFHLYALDDELTLTEGATADELMEVMQGHIIEHAELVGMYGRDDV